MSRRHVAVLAQQHLDEDGPITQRHPAPFGAQDISPVSASVKVAAPTVCKSAGTPVSDVSRISRAPRVVAHRDQSEAATVTPAVRARPGAKWLFFIRTQVARMASPSRSAPFSWVARVLRNSCTNANPPGPGRTAERAIARHGSPPRCVACRSVTVVDPIILWQQQEHLQLPESVLDQVRSLFRDHYGGGVRVAADHRRHDRRVDNA